MPSRPPRRRSNTLAGKVHAAPSSPQRRCRNKGSASSLTQRPRQNKGGASAALYLWQRLRWSRHTACLQEEEGGILFHNFQVK